MAKRNSTKTATKEALAASEPRIIGYTGWSGINIKHAPDGWEPMDDRPNQSDADPKFLMLQNNVETQENGTLESRYDTQFIAKCPYTYPNLSTNYNFVGVCHLIDDKLFVAIHRDYLNEEFPTGMVLAYYELDSFHGDWNDIWQCRGAWNYVSIYDGYGNGMWHGDNPDDVELVITHIYHFQDTLIMFTNENIIYTGSLTDIYNKKVLGRNEDGTTKYAGVQCAVRIPEPTEPLDMQPQEELKVGDVSRLEFCYCYSNKFGTTLPSPSISLSLDRSPVEWSYKAYMTLSGTYPVGMGVTGVDIYMAEDESQEKAFIGHVTIDPESDTGTWEYQYLGAMTDTTTWTSVPLSIPTENTTEGVDAQFCRNHDGRLFFWGSSEHPYRLYMGGNPGAELSVSRGLGGAFVDIDPGSGTVVNGTAKFKTYNGASIVTVMCGNPNTNQVKRFNLLETNVTLTNEITSKGYMTEEVSNVIGCNSPYGFTVYEDGLYALNRYGLAVTTQAMEASNKLQAQFVSDPVEPVFKERLSDIQKNVRLVGIDGKLHLVLACPDDDPNNPSLDRVILVYDIALKSWYTMTLEMDKTEKIQHVFAIDSEKHTEGLGIMTENNIYMIPTTMQRKDVKPDFVTLVETGELSLRKPPSLSVYLCQLEFKFDYIVGDLEILVEGSDYYGRRFTVRKNISVAEMKRQWSEWIRVDLLVETWRIRIKGNAHYRLSHFLAKTYQQSEKINLVYGFDARSSYKNRDDGDTEIHHYLADYNNLRHAIVT